MHLRHTVFFQREELYSRSLAPSRVNWPKLLKRSASIDIIRVTRRDRDGAEQTVLKKQRVSSRGVHVWDVNSTVTKHSDYFVWKGMSERMTRRWDDTSLQLRKRVNSCVWKHLLFWGSSATKEFARKLRKCSLWCATDVKYSKFRGWRRKKTNRALRTCLNPRFARF